MSETSFPAPESQQPDTQRYYDAFGPYYDRELEMQGVDPKFEGLIATAFDHIDPSRVQSVLDLGAGTGKTLSAVKQHADPKRIVAVDLSENMLKVLREKHESPELEVVRSAAEDYLTKAGGEKFDLITSIGVLELLPDAPDAVMMAAKLLNKKGVMAVTYVPRGEGQSAEILNDDSESEIASSMMEYLWYPEEIEMALTARGLDIVDRVNGVRVQEEDAATNTAERVYNFVVAAKP